MTYFVYTFCFFSQFQLEKDIKVNVRTGKKGYYKRTQAQDRSTNLNITVHDSDDAIGAAADTHSKVFAASSKALNTTEAIDAMTLPFFQLGRHPGALHQNRQALPAPSASGFNAPMLQLTNTDTAVPIQDGSNIDDPGNSDNDHDEADKPSVNPMQMIQFAIPSHVKEQPRAKTAPKSSAAKATPKSSSAKETSKGKKRKDEDQQSQKTKIMKLANPAPSVEKPTSEAVVPHALTDADAELLANYNESFTALRKRVLAVLHDTDASINDSLKTCNKDIGTLMKTLKNKMKSLKRRNDHGGETTQSIDGMISEMTTVQSIANRLLSCQHDADVVDELKKIDKMEWNVSAAIFKRGFKCLTLYYLKYSDWTGFSAILSELGAVLGWTNGSLHFELLVSEVIQRLLRALPPKVSCTIVSFKWSISYCYFMMFRIWI